MAAAVVLLPSAINALGGVLPPSAVAQHAPRHGRSRGMSMKGKGGKSRGYSVIEERDVTMAKALMFILKRTIQKSEEDEEGEEQETDNVVASPEGWVSVNDVLAHPRLAALEADLDDVQRIISSATKTRFELRQLPDKQADDAASFEIRRIINTDNVQVPVPAGEKLSADMEDLPDFIIYETSYQRYPLMLASGAITRPGGAQCLSFAPVTVADDGSEARQSQASDAEVSIWIHLRSALQAEPPIVWQRIESGAIVTADEVPKSLWKKAAARRPDIGTLFEDGEVRKEVPAGLRGKGAKGKAKKGKDALKRGSEDDSGSASDE
ncbi:hypothetical protein QBC46DRAFT_321931 [Diplogelasinospora grovesii]|uniref:2'-phosphotransferase n=1 Tax=Diplogelasinospora grovesii TaxID=303347 RepID=A0AAN6S0R5_9PEZI|nr:hypothetical protein QBC46DRAFT_321931 [Diplogelasinospora grovesii]